MDYICQVIFDNGKSLKPVIRKTERGIGNYANRMFRKYGDTMRVEVGYFNEKVEWVLTGTWHA